MRAGTQAVQELKSALPQLREQLDAQGNSVRAIQERVSQLPRNPGTGSELNLEINRLNERIGGLEKQLNQRLDNLTTQLNKSSDSIDNLKLTVQKLRDMGGQTVPGKERQPPLNRAKSARPNP